jgi:hypothetical protein
MNMNIKALITTLAIIGSSSAAMARPVTITAKAEASWSFGTRTPIVVRDHREPVRAPVYQAPVRYEEPREPMMFPSNNALADDASVYRGGYPIATNKRMGYRDSYQWGHSSWVAITAPTRIDRGRQFIPDLPELGYFSTVRLQNVTGTTNVDDVLIRFKDGTEQVVHVNQKLNHWNSTIDIRLDGARKIQGFVINGSSAYGSAYQVLAL